MQAAWVVNSPTTASFFATVEGDELRMKVEFDGSDELKMMDLVAKERTTGFLQYLDMHVPSEFNDVKALMKPFEVIFPLFKHQM